MYNIPHAFRIKGDFGTVYITENGIVDTVPEGVPYLNNIYVDDDIIDRDSFQYHIILKHMYDILDHRYRSDGNIDNIDIVVNYDSYLAFHKMDIIMYHGDIEISNTLGHKALLKEVYTKTIVRVYKNHMKFMNLKLFRSRMNSIEAVHRSQHSHAPRQSLVDSQWLPMCLGDSELYTHFFKRKRKYTDMSLYCMYLDAYLAWESKEGGPYNTIESVYNCETSDDVSINDIDIDSIIYDNADIFEVIESNNRISISSDFVNKIQIDDIPKQNNYSKFLDFKNLHMINTDYPNPIGSNVKFRNKNLLITVEDACRNELLPYVSTMYVRIPDKVVNMIKERISSIINFNYAENRKETVRDNEIEEQVRTVGIETEG
jgi:hypothetical protein